LEELKELLRRTSQVEKSLCQIEAADEDCGAPYSMPEQQAQPSSTEERPDVDLDPDIDWQNRGVPESRANHRDCAERNAWGEEGVPITKKASNQGNTARRAAQSPPRNCTRYFGALNHKSSGISTMKTSPMGYNYHGSQSSVQYCPLPRRHAAFHIPEVTRSIESVKGQGANSSSQGLTAADHVGSQPRGRRHHGGSQTSRPGLSTPARASHERLWP